MKKIFLLSILCFSSMFFGCWSKTNQKNEPFEKQKEILKKPSFVEITQKKLLEEHNKQRESKGIKALVLDKELCEYAQAHSEKMVDKNSLYHSQISKLQNKDASVVGENVAWGQETPESVVNAWMWSPMHRWNILGSSYKKVGFGVSKDKDGRIYWCTVFTN